MDEEFPNSLDQLISATKFNPIYSHAFALYYKEVAGQERSNNSLIVLKDNLPIVGFICSDGDSEQEISKLDYFGLQAALISNENVEMDSLVAAMDTLNNFLAKSKSHPFNLIHPELVGSLRINDPRILNTHQMKKLLPKFSKSQTRFNLVIDLRRDLKDLVNSYSKSVRSALREKVSHNICIEVIDRQSTDHAISLAFQSLRDLHFYSAGRVTRSNESWNIQESFLRHGHAFITQSRRNGEIVSSAYFMNTPFDAYYGVSASSNKVKGIPLSHLCVTTAITHCKEKGILTFHMGEQHSGFSEEISAKEKNIEKFKSFFGGEIKLEIVFIK
jgi:hypothetical protein